MCNFLSFFSNLKNALNALNIQPFHLPLLFFDKQATSLPHLLLCVITACLISLISLVGFYDTVSFFHTRWESVAGVVLCE